MGIYNPLFAIYFATKIFLSSFLILFKAQILLDLVILPFTDISLNQKCFGLNAAFIESNIISTNTIIALGIYLVSLC